MRSWSCSSSSSVPTPRIGWTYDVFLSFRGEDTRNSFVDHLYAALIQKGIHTFKDNFMLGGGEETSSALLNAIQESRFAVVVLSKYYANSSWCLEELAKIMECHHQMGQKVLPVFYHVDPSDVRGQKKDFETAFEQHELKFKGEMDKVNKWRQALTAVSNISGHHISAFSGGEAAIVNKIVEETFADNPARGRENNLIGMESHMKRLNSKLHMEDTRRVRTIGILGMGGIGKTTIARVLFKRISYKFVGSSFVKDIRENSSTPKDICTLQENILKDILGGHRRSIRDPESGADMIQERLRNKKVLLVLDDVDDFKQLEFLAESNEWFGSGSRIIITTRNEQLLSDANSKYKPALLTNVQALELFSRHAFRKNKPPVGYKDLSNRAIRYTGRLPLALKVLGSFFRGRQASVWESALDRLAKTPLDKVIFDTLKLSFDNLNGFEQKMFLDIACFYKGEIIEDVTRVLDSFGFHAVIGMSVLIEKSLITVSKERIRMHDLIQEMGRQIVGESFPNSRLWKLEQIHDFPERNREREVIEAISVQSQVPNQGVSVDVFESMKSLRLLNVQREFTSSEPTLLPDKLQWLRWEYYPFSSLPVASNMHKLVGLEMKCSKIEHLWTGHKNMGNLKFINLHNSVLLTRLPDVSGAPNVERFILSHCKKLVEVHDSFGFLKKLTYLDMSSCFILKCLPSRLEMESLETLNLSYCKCLKRFPELSPGMVKLSHIDLTACSQLEELPSSIKYLFKLSFLRLSMCTRLDNIPNSICQLKCLKSLNLNGCSKLQSLPDEFERIENLKELRLLLPASVSCYGLTNLRSLRILDLKDSQIEDKAFPENFYEFSCLEELNLSGNKVLLELPASISHLSRLNQLNISDCYKLQNWHKLPSGIQVLKAIHCMSLKKIDNLSEDYGRLYKIYLYGCYDLLEGEQNERYLDKMLEKSFLKKCAAVDRCLSIGVPRRTIPSWFKEQQEGNTISLKLPPKWETKIMGFAICGVYKRRRLLHEHITELIFKMDGLELVPQRRIDPIDAFSLSRDASLWIGYVPLSLFKQLNDGDGDDNEDWSHVIEGNLVINLLCYYSCDAVVRCGAKVVHKKEVALTQQIQPSIPPYWNWEIRRTIQYNYICAASNDIPIRD